MPKHPNTSQAQRAAPRPALASETLPPAVKSPAVSVPQQPTVTAKPKTFLARAKGWAWRFTAAYFWLHAALTVSVGHDPFSGIETAITAKIVALLSWLGFAPVNVGHLPLVFLAIWLLTITEFSPIQLLIGLPLYVVVFPFVALLVLLYHKQVEADTATKAVNQVPQARKKHFPWGSVSAAMLVGWFLLYSGSSSRGPNLVGFLLSLALLLTLVYRALDKTSPIDDQDTAFLETTALRGILLISNAMKTATEKPRKTKLELESGLRTNGFLIRPFRRAAVLIHGRKGRDRIAMVMLLEYVIFLVLVAFSAILFWALAIKAAVPSELALPLTAALRVSASHFLPGIGVTSPMQLPWWAEFGPALTSWVLFVVYIGPVGSALPLRQESFLRQMIPAQKYFLQIGKLWHAYRRVVRVFLENLPK